MDVLWPDAEIQSVSFDYDSLRLTLAESSGQTVVVEADVARNTRSFQTLVVTLIDGAVFQAEAASFKTRRGPVL